MIRLVSQLPDLHIVFAEPFDDCVLKQAASACRVTCLPACSDTTLMPAVVDCDALVVRSRARVTAQVIAAAKRLRVIGRAGVGLENIDLDAAKKRGIPVVYTPHAATDAVADLTVAMILALARKLPFYDAVVRRGEFERVRDMALPEMRDLTLGIVGLGRIGTAVARRCCLGFGMRVVYNDLQPIDEPGIPAAFLEKADLFSQADVVSLHVPLTEQTRNLVDAAALARFKPGAILINTARGKIVDSAALAAALHEGRLGGAGIDVFDEEPPPAQHPLLSAPNVLLTPHIAARTVQGLQNMGLVIEDVLRVLRGETPQYPAQTE